MLESTHAHHWKMLVEADKMISLHDNVPHRVSDLRAQKHSKIVENGDEK